MEKVVLLINPGHEEEAKKLHTSKHKQHRDIPPVSLLYIGGYLQSHGYNVRIVDAHLEPNYNEVIRHIIAGKDVLFVGVTVFVGAYLKNAIEISKFIKTLNDSIPVVWGGAFPSIWPNLMINEPFVDIVVQHEGEETALELCNAIDKGRPFDSIDGIIFKKNNETISNPIRELKRDVNKYPIPGWNLIGEKLNKEQIPYLAYLFTSRGCIYNCTFCYHCSRYLPRELKWCGRSIEHVMKEVDYLSQQYGINVFTINDDNFLVDKDRAKGILNGFKERGFFVEQCGVSFFDLNEEIIESFSGVCQTLIYSIESTVPRLQRLFGKQVDLKRLAYFDSLIAERGMNSYHNFIICLPDETDEDLRSNVQFMAQLKKINPYVRGISFLFLPLPGTPLYTFIDNKYNLGMSDDIYKWINVDFNGNAMNFELRPWLKSKEDYQFYIDFKFIFDEVFKSNNLEISDKVFELIDNSKRLKDIFGDIKSIQHPATTGEKYLLDKMIL